MRRTFIIAEAGVNHNGSLRIAKKLIDLAAIAGADAVKFQSFNTEQLVCKYTPKARYQIKNTLNSDSQFSMLKSLELSEKAHFELAQYCQKKKIKFMSTPFDLQSVDLLERLNLDIYKVPSGEITNYPLLVKIAKLRKKVILSTGMSTLKEISDAIKVLLSNGLIKNKLSILHTTSEYPCPFNEVNLFAMVKLSKKYSLNYGYSDHTTGISVPIAAVALGASIIEKHFTLDNSMHGPDHKASLNPEELKSMVREIRLIEMALGNDKKIPTKSELINLEVARKYLVAAKAIKKGEFFNSENITTKRSGNGISPMKYNEILGKKAKKNFYPDEIISI